MEKILFVGAFDECFHPYMLIYDDILGRLNIRASFIFWNRNNFYDLSRYKNLDISFFDYQMNTYKSAFKKINGYLKYKKFVVKKIKTENYDKVVVLTTQMAIMILNILKRKYKNKFIFDFRDETYERKSRFFKHCVSEIINASFFTVISSPGFKKIFNNKFDNKMVLCHNIKPDFFDKCEIKKVPSKKIRFSFWGMIRQIDYFKKVIKCINSNDSEIHFYGEGYTNDLKKFILENKINNVYIHGKYTQKDILNFVENTDFLINAYSNKGIQEYSLTVKMYEGIKFGLPIIVQKNSFMDMYLKKNHYPCIAIDFDNDETEVKYDFTADKTISKSYILDIILSDMKNFYIMIEKFLGGQSEKQ